MSATANSASRLSVNQREAARKRERQLRQLDRRAPIRQAGDRLITSTTKGESVSLSLEEFRRLRPDVPPPPRIKAKAGVTQDIAEDLRTWVWQQPFNRCDLGLARQPQILSVRSPRYLPT